jgi:cyclic pyranopterin phosphate synthase
MPETAYELVTSSYPTEASKTTLPSEQHALEKARGKGHVLTIAQLAAIMGAKATSNLIPLCHPLALSKIDVSLVPEHHGTTLAEDGHKTLRHSILCTATVCCEGKTGVEMEALTAVSVGLLTVWDMLKAVAGKEMEIGQIMVTHKSGGRSGDFDRCNQEGKT